MAESREMHDMILKSMEEELNRAPTLSEIHEETDIPMPMLQIFYNGYDKQPAFLYVMTIKSMVRKGTLDEILCKMI